MPEHSRWLWLRLVCVGCQSLGSAEGSPKRGAAVRQPAAEPEDPPARAAARQFWEEGQKAMRQGQPERAIALYEQSLAPDPRLARGPLSLAAAYLDEGD